MDTIRLIVFDWDGTLMDSAGLIVSSLQNACRDLALTVPDEASARYVIGLGLHDSLSHILPGVPVSQYAQVAERYRFHFITRDHETPLFAGAQDMLGQLRGAGLRLAVATGKSRAGLDRALGHTGIGSLFDSSRCADETAPKPDPTMLLELMEELDVGAHETLMVGDTSHDLRMALAAGVGAVAVTYGAHTMRDLAPFPALTFADSVAELSQWLMKAA